MKKVTIILALIILLLFVCCSFESDRIDLSDDSFYAFYIDETLSNAPPASTDGYIFDHADCTNGASITWNNDDWNATVNNLTSTRTKCTLYFILDNHTNLVIARLVGNADQTSTDVINKGAVYDTDGTTELCTNTLAYDDYGNLRFVGANPCNYVTFNGETAGWRIIGIIEDRVKLIRSESIGFYSWDTSASGVNNGYGINMWGESDNYNGGDLMKLLNPGYDTNLAEDSSGNTITGTYVNNSLYWNRGSGNCYNARTNAYTTCDFTSIGLTSEAKNMIYYSRWRLGANEARNYPYDNIKAIDFYSLERLPNTGKMCSSGKQCNDNVIRTSKYGTTIWEGYIGLMSPSDYGYAVGGDVRTTCLSKTLRNYYTDDCMSNDWLHNGTFQWTTSPARMDGAATMAFALFAAGHFSANFACTGGATRPAFNLKSSVRISGGAGTTTNPYTLSLN